MATRGKRPKPAYLKLVQGNPGRRPIEVPSGPDVREGPLRSPKKLTSAQSAIWKRFIDTAHWLTEHDAPKAYMWTCLQAQFHADTEMKPAAVGQLRLLGSELGLDPSARARLGISTKKDDDPNAKYFD